MSLNNRPGPLQPYDLRLFMADAIPVGPFNHHTRPNKRPYSPSVGILDGPAKRRLKAEGSTRSPKLPESPLSGSSSSARFAPAHFHALLQGPDSPAKRLDFGSSEASDMTACEAPRSRAGGSGTPRRSPKRTAATKPVRRSPRLAARTFRSPSGSFEPSVNTGADAHIPTIRTLNIAPLVAPRVVTPPDRQSIHYPGFDIYQDPHIVPMAYHAIVTSADSTPDSYPSDTDCNKENVIPRRKSSKKTSAPVTPSDHVWVKAGLLSPSVKSSTKKKPVPASPHPKHVYDYLALTTPKERVLRPTVSPAATLVGTTPIRTPLGKDARKEMRRAMEAEVDDVADEDELLL